MKSNVQSSFMAFDILINYLKLIFIIFNNLFYHVPLQEPVKVVTQWIIMPNIFFRNVKGNIFLHVLLIVIQILLKLPLNLLNFLLKFLVDLIKIEINK